MMKHKGAEEDQFLRILKRVYDKRGGEGKSVWWRGVLEVTGGEGENDGQNKVLVIEEI